MTETYSTKLYWLDEYEELKKKKEDGTLILGEEAALAFFDKLYDETDDEAEEESWEAERASADYYNYANTEDK